MNILVVDDDEQILELVQIHLQQEGYNVIKAHNGIEALDATLDILPDLAVVDVMMPEMDGFTLTKELRKMEIPVLLLTAKGELEDKEKGFLAGSDDYLVKPFEPKELLFRIQAILRRYDKSVDPTLTIGSLTINQRSYEVTSGNKTLLFPLKEFELLSVLASRINHVFTREFLIDRIWGMDYEGDDQTLNVHIKRLREKFRTIAPDIKITTIRGVGYKLEVSS